ncbi:hypothetical protein ACEQPO_17100 [Bacillus sp. SL00103]
MFLVALKKRKFVHIIASFKEATRRAVEAGFDGVEKSRCKQFIYYSNFTPRIAISGQIGGKVEEKRLAFPIAVVDAVKEAIEKHATKPFIFDIDYPLKNQKRLV